MPLDRANIQGNILQPYSHPVAAFLFYRIEEAAGAREWLAELIGHVTTAEPWGKDKPTTTLNISFRSEGLRALGLPDERLQSFALEFREGMAEPQRVALLGDDAASGATHWEDDPRMRDVHLMVSIYALPPDSGKATAGPPPALTSRIAWLEENAAQTGGVRLLFRQDAVRPCDPGSDLPGPREHFGFVDGIGQPTLDPDGSARSNGGRSRPIQLGEFLLGHIDEDGLLPLAPDIDALARDGSYVVFRKLRQDVAGFRAFLKEQAHRFPGGEAALAARIMGRWQDGTPVTLSPHRPDSVLAADTTRNDDFGFAGDADGWRCPIGAHIRRANPRDSLPFGEVMVRRHRILRRGIPYGPPLPEGAPDDGVDRGLLFLCFQASIQRQFEFIQAAWLNDGNKFGLGLDRDPIVGGGGGKLTLQGSPPRFLSPLARFVTLEGGDYFYMPGLAGLRYLANMEGS